MINVTNIKKTAMMKTVLRLLLAMLLYIDQKLRNSLELNINRILNRSGLSLIDFEKLFVLLETEHAGEDIGREDFALGVKVPHYSVVETARGLDLVLRVGQ